MKNILALIIPISFGILFFQNFSEPSESAVPVTPTTNEINGIYMLVNAPELPDSHWRAQIYERALNSPGVAGISIEDKWSAIQPQFNNGNDYHFDRIDHWVKEAVRHGKKIQIGIAAGSWTPEWLFSEPFNAPSVAVTYDNQPKSSKPTCVTSVFPIPWRKRFIHRYLKMMEALSNHLQTLEVENDEGGYYPSGSAWKAIKVVKLGGINISTVEIKMGATKDSDHRCQDPNRGGAPANPGKVWIDAGYTPAKVLGAWGAIADGIADLFPGKTLSLGIIADYAFPGDSGFGGNSLDGLTEDIIKYATNPSLQKAVNGPWNNRVTLQWNAVSNYTSAVENVINSRAITHHTQLGWQMNNGLGPQGTACGGSFHLCTQSEYLSIFPLVTNHYQGDFVEIHAENFDQAQSSHFEFSILTNANLAMQGLSH